MINYKCEELFDDLIKEKIRDISNIDTNINICSDWFDKKEKQKRGDL